MKIRVLDVFKQPLSIHVGDIKSGSSSCANENILKIKDYFATFERPLVYTPGDNEWTDCHRDAAGKFDPLERLGFLRQTFFGQALSQGKRPMLLERQADVSDHKQMVENSRWQKNNVLFATLNIVGSNNGFERTPESVAEFFARDAANVAWIKDSFAKAKSNGNAAVVLAFQADMFFTSTAVFGLPANAGENSYAKSGFAKTLAALSAEAAAFAKPVLLIHGDSHILIIDQPLTDSKGALLENVTRLEVIGAAGRTHAVEVSVDPKSDNVFGFKVLWSK
jgi:pimeloyl-ACP methyl ester carboxylesterase